MDSRDLLPRLHIETEVHLGKVWPQALRSGHSCLLLAVYSTRVQHLFSASLHLVRTPQCVYNTTVASLKVVWDIVASTVLVEDFTTIIARTVGHQSCCRALLASCNPPNSEAFDPNHDLKAAASPQSLVKCFPSLYSLRLIINCPF